MMDLAPYTRWTLITGIAGEAWESAAEKVAREFGVPLSAVVIGPGREVTDLYYDWAKLREVEEAGALLVRPDKHIAWRSMGLPGGPGGRAACGHGRDPGKIVSVTTMKFEHVSLPQRVRFGTGGARENLAAEIEALARRGSW